MYVKALELQGFKSFPDKTVLQFASGFTAIVGPNGSGKSNISDAIRWVMGEQSSRTLRGGKMEDVIFGGTEKRGKMGFAQVTLLLDNTEHIIPGREENEVAVTRRAYRSGESEYYINRRSVRLRDVAELFMDTGLGREGYAVIGQGRIDEILSVKSSARREIFEEAAGISRFRHRKEEAERRLEQTQENLVRVNDKIAELALQVEPLREQAEKAKRFLILRDELRALEISVWLTQLEALKTAALRLETEAARRKTALDEANAALTALFDETERLSGQIRANDVEQERARAGLAALEAELREHETAAAAARAEAAHHEDTIARAEDELRAQRERAGSLDEQSAGHRARLAALREEAAALETGLAVLAERVRALSGDADAASDAAERARAREAQALSEAAGRRAEVSALRAGLREQAARAAALETEYQALTDERDALRRAAGEGNAALAKAKGEADALRNAVRGYAIKLESRRRREQEAEEQRQAAVIAQNELESRVRLLGEMEREYEGFGRAVRLVMRSRGALRGIHGPAANLMTADSRVALAIETALGAATQHIVVEREEDAKAAIAFLKRCDGGRATFLPLTSIRGSVLREPALDRAAGFVGVASELVAFEPRYREIFTNLLGRTAVVETLDDGIALARACGYRFRVVTLDGQVLHRGGSMTGGSAGRNTGVLSRANELSALREKRETLAAALEQAAEAARAARSERTRTAYEMETAREEQRAAEERVLTLESERTHRASLLASLDSRLAAAESERGALRRRAETAEAEAAEKEAAAAEKEREAAGYAAEAEAGRAGQGRLRQDAAALTEELAARQSALAANRAEDAAAERALRELEALRASLRGDETDRRALLERCRAAKEAALRAAAGHEEARAARGRDRETAAEALNDLAQAKFALEAARGRNERLSRERNEAVLDAERALSALEQKRAANAMEEKQLLDRLWDSYELSHSAALEQCVELESLPAANRRIGELKRAIRQLGGVNTGAIEEFERVNARYTYLTGQRDDVETARKELQGIIDGITREMSARFAEQFARIRESFQATFRELFGGGQATLELEDENDILRCGIEIRVQPPGKALRTLTLLSGGEKAFVAIALYFSILKVHPTPFCVMDEAEAALDESNVIRVANYLRRMTERTQFIVITHRRGTMEAADTLFGVTMQERGVSRVLAVDIDSIEREWTDRERQA